MKNKNSKNNNVTNTLNEINAQIEALHQKRVNLSEPLKARHAELRNELLGIEGQIRELDSTWKSVPIRGKADEKIKELLNTNGGTMTEAQLVTATKGLFSKWKLKQVLKKHFAVDGAGLYSVKAA